MKTLKFCILLLALLLALCALAPTPVGAQTLVAPVAEWTVSEEVPWDPGVEWAFYAYYELPPGVYVAQYAYGNDGRTENIAFDLRREDGLSRFTWRNPIRENYLPVTLTILDLTVEVEALEAQGYTFAFGRIF